MKKLFLAGLVITAFVVTASFAGAAESIKMSTTTSTRDSGLLDYLLPEFTKDTGIEVMVIAKGTGAAIRDGVDGNVDVIFVHDPDREKKFVADGWGTKRYEVMHNDFVIVGSPKDPAKIKGEKNVLEALKKIAAAKTPFISRGDDSGTHSKELGLWKKTGLPLTKSEQTIKKADKDTIVTFEVPEGWVWCRLGDLAFVLSFLSRLILPSLIKRSFSFRIRSNRTDAGSSLGSCGTSLPRMARSNIF